MSKKVKIILVIIGSLILGSVFFTKETSNKYYRTYSPDGQYSRYATIKEPIYNFLNFDALPFEKFSDKPGKLYVYDELEDKIVGSSSLEMIGNIYETEWHEE